MFKSLFHSGRVLARHINSPLAEERNTFLTHLTLLGTSRSTLLRHARQLRVIARLLDKHVPGHVTLELIGRCAQRWALRQRQRGRAHCLTWSAKYFFQVARAWCRFMGWLKEKPRPAPAYVEQLQAWAAFLRVEEGLAEKTSADYCWWADGFLRWLKGQEVPLRCVTVAEVDGYLSHLAARGLSRITLAIAAKTLRRFFRHAYAQKWCRQDLASLILAPRLFQQEILPAGPKWSEVQRLTAPQFPLTLLTRTNLPTWPGRPALATFCNEMSGWKLTNAGQRLCGICTAAPLMPRLTECWSPPVGCRISRLSACRNS